MSRIYHVWFATKRRGQFLLGDIEDDAKRFIREVAREKRVHLLECETAVDHVHLLLRLDGRQSLPRVMNWLKGSSSYRLHRAYPDLKLDTGCEHFWQRGYGFTVVEPGSLSARRRYINTQQERLDRLEGRIRSSRVL